MQETRPDQLGALRERVDAFFGRVSAAHPGQMQCRRGCSACCQRDLRLLPVEWRRVEGAVMALPEGERAEIRRALARPVGEDPCALLAADGSCRVFSERPLVCRSHGLPIRLGEALTTCSLNFRGTLGAVPPGDVLDQGQLSVVLGLVDRLAGPEGDDPEADADGRISLDAALARRLG